MTRISGDKLAQQTPSASCCRCGREADSARGMTWTIQGSHFYCKPCADYEGLY